MHLLHTDCEIYYEGRGSTHAPRGVRLVMIKSDNSVAIHQDKDIKPVNYMSKATSIEMGVEEDGYTHLYASSSKESIHVVMYEVLFEQHLDLDVSDLERYGTESQVQEWLSCDGFKSVFGSSVDFVCREYQTGRGPCDLLGLDKSDGQVVLIEVKRTAKRSDVFQLLRYKSALLEYAGDSGEFVTTLSDKAVSLPRSAVVAPHMCLVALKFKPGVKDECRKFGIIALRVNPDDVLTTPSKFEHARDLFGEMHGSSPEEQDVFNRMLSSVSSEIGINIFEDVI